MLLAGASAEESSHAIRPLERFVGDVDMYNSEAWRILPTGTAPHSIRQADKVKAAFESGRGLQSGDARSLHTRAMETSRQLGQASLRLESFLQYAMNHKA
jgi:hypothetical protein